jgi:hypothetical protein
VLRQDTEEPKGDEVSTDDGNQEDDRVIFVSDIFKVGKAIVGVVVSVPAVLAVCLSINLLLWNKIDAVSINLNTKIESSNKDISTKIESSNKDISTKIESSNKDINENINKKFEKVALSFDQINGRVFENKAEIRYIEGTLKSSGFKR